MKISFSFKKNPLFRFIFFFILLYSALYFVHEGLIKEYTVWDQRFIAHIIVVSEKILNLAGYQTFKSLSDRDYQLLGVDGTNGVWVGSGCNAITLFNLFLAFMLPFPGRQLHKIWYIPLSLLVIHLANILRVCILCIIALHAPQTLEFNHTYTFTFLIYLMIFYFWMIWVRKFSGIQATAINEKK